MTARHLLSLACALAWATAPAAAGDPGAPQAVSPAPPAPAAAPAPPRVLGTRDLSLRFRLAEKGAADIQGYVLHYTLDGGSSWVSEEKSTDGDVVRFHAPRDGRYGFALSAVDTVGARSAAPASGERPALEAIVDTTPPHVRVIRPDRQETVGADTRVQIEWESRDENEGPRPIEIAASLDGGPWDPILEGAPPSGRHEWSVPLLPGEVRLRFRARDLAGNSSELVTPPVFRITQDSASGSRWVAVPPHSSSRRVPVYFRLVREEDSAQKPLGPEELRRVQVWYRTQGLAWTEGGLDPDRRSPLIFQAPDDGRFEILLTAVDRQGRWIPPQAAPGPGGLPDHNLAPHARCLVDTREPRVQIETPVAGAWVDAGTPLSIRYRVEEENPRPHGVTVSSSLDGGKSWTVLAEGLDLEPAESGAVYRGELRLNLPLIETESFLLRVTALDLCGGSGEASTEMAQAMTIRNSREDPAKKAQEHYRRGVVQLHALDAAEQRRAIESFRRALLYQPGHAAAHHDLAVALETLAPAGTAASPAPAVDEPLAHYRQAHQVAPGDPRFAFSLVGALLKRSEAPGAEAVAPLRAEAEQVFQKISWARVVELGETDREESQRLRLLYRSWKEQYFRQIPR